MRTTSALMRIEISVVDQQVETLTLGCGLNTFYGSDITSFPCVKRLSGIRFLFLSLSHQIHSTHFSNIWHDLPSSFPPHNPPPGFTSLRHREPGVHV